MLDDEQLAHLEGWLEERKDELKFVVTSVPFLAELRSKRSRSGSDERDDKWAGRHFRRQRDDLLELIHGRRIGRLVFLVGDMHCTYHVITRIGTPERRTTLHELAGGPIHQLEFAKRDTFHDDYRGATQGGKLAFRTRMRQFHGAAAGVLQVTVRPGDPPAVLWTVVRTNRSADAANEPRPLCGRIDL
jgi:phosphodiesterase/alkaline phosphatase D-like protein